MKREIFLDDGSLKNEEEFIRLKRGQAGHFRQEEEHFPGDRSLEDLAVFGDPGIMCWC